VIPEDVKPLFDLMDKIIEIPTIKRLADYVEDLPALMEATAWSWNQYRDDDEFSENDLKMALVEELWRTIRAVMDGDAECVLVDPQQESAGC
jgi:hypothetical protein